MTARQLTRLAAHVLSWEPSPGCAVQITLHPLHGTATITVASNSGTTATVTAYSPSRKKEVHFLLFGLASQVTPCSCPLCRAAVAEAQAQAQAAASMPRPIADRLRFDGGHSGCAN